MIDDSQQQKAKDLLALHSNAELLVLPNIWNPIGARLLESKGYPAVATASAAISASLGYADGEVIKFSTLIDVITRIARAVSIPVTADIEAGFADTISELRANVGRVIESGLVGINIEDSLQEGGALRPALEQAERIAAIRDAANDLSLHLVINARVDCFLSNDYSTVDEKVAESLLRARIYGDAGADCIFPVGAEDLGSLKRLRAGISLPINILAFPGAIPLVQMQEMGVNRVSFGPAIFRSCLKKLSDISDELYQLGDYGCIGDDTVTYEDTQDLLVSDPE